ncbi:MAG: acetyltransferase [Phycisphaerae bacterium]
MHETLLVGAGGLLRLVRDILSAAPGMRPVEFDGVWERFACSSLPQGVLPDEIAALWQRGVRRAVVALEDNLARVAMAEALECRGFELCSAIHPLASISPSARLGRHVIVGARAIVCVHARIESHCVLSTASIAEHDNELGLGVRLETAARLAGGVQVDAFATVGVGSSVIPYRKLGKHVVVRPGSVVIRDVPDGAVVAGVPARSEPSGPLRFVAEDRSRFRGARAQASGLGASVQR